jgi:hypothetical protein
MDKNPMSGSSVQTKGTGFYNSIGSFPMFSTFFHQLEI